ncbi:unnamed protein product [Acanthoscelides obtectus]|uniref:Uncharacterized protein n=1 Tax=Acanthoscelides obtectus TaxID=200917 RepID=A0A9P0JFQ1_ACAOB|nr:unnamed protein product [Acanthoscelides obtectus]CAK1661399.1 hypothetical protein AOBTE_LOCUS22602 [Acanthoscelides obtectus]
MCLFICCAVRSINIQIIPVRGRTVATIRTWYGQWVVIDGALPSI